ncbi:hypothetical protein [Oceanithermus sp.]
MHPEPCSAGPGDAKALQRALTAAFLHDPVMVWFDPDRERRQRRLARLFGHVLHKHLPRGMVWTNENRSAAVWVAPGTPVTAKGVRFYLRLCRDRQLKGFSRRSSWKPSGRAFRTGCCSTWG